jgi:dTDP-4-amino-4,6-dideoxygalactose transaminase
VIPYGRQSLNADDQAAVKRVLDGDWLTTGPAVEEFEAALVAVTGARHAVVFSNGTAALHGAAAVAGLGPGSRVATSALSFVASANCARYVGADPCFVDISPNTLNLDPGQVPSGLDALVAVHYAGLPVDLSALAHRPRVIIEDGAHALGAMTPDGPVGSCPRSDMCTFSFHPVKAITTGEGGAVTTNSDRLADLLRAFRSHGMVPKPQHGAWYYEVETVSYNYRLTDIQAALGTSQLSRLTDFVARRQALAARYHELLADLPIQLPPAATRGFTHAYHLFPVRVERRREVYDALRAEGIGVQVHYVPLYRHPVMAMYGVPEAFPETERAYNRLLSLPLFPGLTDQAQDQVVAALEKAL